MQVVAKTPRIEIDIKGDISKKLLKVLKDEFGKDLKIQEDEAVPFREGEFWKKYGKLATPGNHMKTYRSIMGLSQSALGEKLGGVGRSHISEMESGKRPIGKDTAKKLASIFQVSVEMFL
ncbi:helix-turn-helix transcriptional regulator [Leptospira stimsonii]|uniref:XRE family transcriptional regulator n=1 Tax=Leptospira stimsonii TaxID=2202203 RepID=A0ABY2N590_9LEPT|nr:helix-turn-helix transcriptional regulator [Leptospira stimsonii]TGK10396.1 XRE family transcriptional regulator [Leptospira stimsonii]TGM17261.1 XRE family transcriptional regulator [Leptospira stimsonii]